MRKSIGENADGEATVEDLEQWEKDFGPLPSPVVVIFNFGWAPKYSNRTEYLGIHPNDENDLHFPGVSKGINILPYTFIMKLRSRLVGQEPKRSTKSKYGPSKVVRTVTKMLLLINRYCGPIAKKRKVVDHNFFCN